MSLPVGMSAPVAAPAFQPVAPTPQSTQQAPMMSAPSPYRQRGYASNPMASLSDEPYVPPVWARTINVSDPSWTQPGQAAANSGYTPPGVPERFQVNPFGDDPIRSFLGDQNTQAFLGMAPAPGQRGGSYYGLATAPITLANFTPWGREGLLAAALSLTGSGDDWTPKEGAQFGEQPTGPEDGGGPVDWFARGAQSFGDMAWKAIDAPMKWYRDSNAFNRAKSVRNLFQSGDAHPVIGSELITTAIFGGKERFTMEAIQRVAAQQGIDYIDLMAKWYDFSPEQVAMIAANPFMNDDALGDISDGTPLSNDMLSNLALEGGMLLATMAIGGSGLARGATALGKAGLESVGAFGAGVRGAQLAAGASRSLTAARAMGTITRRAMQINSMNTVAGWSIRGAELGIKQLAIIAGNDELVNAMDRMLWVQPLSMNPGWQLLDGFTAHPIDTYRNLRHGQVSIGRPTSPGYVGQLDLKGLAVRGTDGQVMTLDILGRKVTLGPEAEEFKALARLRDLTPEQMHTSFFKRLGWSMEDMNLAFGEGNPYGRTWNDVRNGLFHVALEAVRESKGQLGRLEGVDLPTYAMRTAAFVRNNAKGAMKMLDRNLTGESDEMVRLFKSDFWDLAKRNDTTMGELKAYLGDAYDPAAALADFASWIRASKIVRDAIASRVARADAVPAYRRTVNREFVSAWRNKMAAAVGPDEVVPLSAINQLKRLGGAIEMRGRGSELVRGRRSTYTRKQLEEILDDVEREDDLWQRRSNQAPHAQAAAYRKGVDPGQDPLEDARVAGLSPADVQTIQRVTGSGAPPTALPPPHLLAKVAKATGRTADGLRALGPEGAWKAVTDWFDTRLAAAADTARQRDALDNAAGTFEGRAAAGRMAPAAAHQAAVALRRIRDELLAPLDEKVAKNRPGLWQTWDTTRQEALILASELETHLADPLARLAVARNLPGQEWVLPPNVGQDALRAWADLAERIAAYAPAEADRALLLDPSIHPFAKTEVMKRSVGGPDEAELARLAADIGGAPDDVLISALNDLEPRAPGDPPHTLSEVDGLNGRVIGYERAGDDLAARAGQVARRFDNLGGAWSDEMQATMDRVWAHAPKYKAAQPKGAPRDILRAEMDPDAPGRAAARQQAEAVRTADRKVAEAADRVARAQRAVDDPATYTPPTVAEVENLTWTDLPGGTFDEGVDAVKKQAADQFAAEYRRNNDGARVWVENRKKPNRYVVRVASPAREAAPAPIPGSRALKPFQQADAVRRNDAAFLAGADEANGAQFSMDNLPGVIEDPNVADADLAALKEYVTKERELLEADLRAHPLDDPTATDRRTVLLAEMQAREAAFEKRSQQAPTRVDSTPLAEGPGDAAPPRADVSTQPGALEEPGQQPPWDLSAVVGEADRLYQGPARGYAHSYISWIESGSDPAAFDAQWPGTLPGPKRSEIRSWADAQRPTPAAPAPEAPVGQWQAQVKRDDGWYSQGTFATREEAFAAQGSQAGREAYRVVGESQFTDRMTERAAAASSGQGAVPVETPALGGTPRFQQGQRAGDPELTSGEFLDPKTDAPIPFRIIAIEATDLITSADEGFDTALQPRMRWARSASRQQIVDIANDPNPAKLLGTESGAQGMPVVLEDGQVLAGNGRVTGLRGSTPESRARYRSAVDRMAARTGIDTQGMDNPVLVRVIDVPREDAVRLALQLNLETDLPIADAAIGLSRILTVEDIQKFRIGAGGLEDSLESAVNDEFVAAFKEHLPKQFLNSLTESDGSLSQKGKDLIAATLIARFTGAAESEAGQVLLATLFEGDASVRSLASGMDAVGALIAAQIEAVGKPWETVPGRFAADLVPALQRVFDLQKQMGDLRTVESSLMAVGALMDSAEGMVELTAQQQVLAANLARMAQPGPNSGAAAFRRLLRNVAKRVRGMEENTVEQAPEDLWGDATETFDRGDPTYPDVVNDAFRALNQGRSEGRQFEYIPGNDGITSVKVAGVETARIHPKPIESTVDAVDALMPAVVDELILEGDSWADAPARIARSSGRIVVRVDTPAEAERMVAYLGGDDASALHRSYRVVDGVYEPLGDIRGEVVDRINGRYKREDSRQQAIGYLNRMLHGGYFDTGESYLDVPANIRKFVDSELDYRQGREVPTDPHLPGLRKALEGREYEVRVVGDPAEVVGDARPPIDGPVFYHGSGREGGRASTGVASWDERFFVSHDPEIAGLYGPEVREVRLRPGARVVDLGSPEFEALQERARQTVTSGRMLDEAAEMVRLAREDGVDVLDFRKDFIGAVVVNEDAVVSGGRSAAPVLDEAAAPPPGDVPPVTDGVPPEPPPEVRPARQPISKRNAPPPTTIVTRKNRQLRPNQREITGVDPASPIRDMAARSSADAGENRIVPSGDAHADRAERGAAGAPIVDDGGILVRNTPDQTGVRAIAEAALAKEQAALEAAQQARARLGEAPADGPPPADILSGPELDLWHRYTSDSSAIGRPPMQPQTVGQVVHALESLDLDMPPLVATMTDAEMRDLRGALYRVLHSRLTELGADAAPPPNARPPRTGPGVKHTVGTPRMADEEILLTTPEDMSADFAEVMGTLQGRVFESDDPLAGWEGTQYEIGALPVRGRDGGPLSPRIQYDDWVNRLDDVVPGLGDEVLHGRKQTWQGREEEHRFTESLRNLGAFKSTRSLMDTAFGARPEKDIVRQAIDRFTAALLKDFKGDQKAYDQAVRDVHTIIGALHEHMRLKEIAKFPKYRRIGLVPADQFEDVARKAFGGTLPDWLNTYVVDAQKAGVKNPIAEAWRVADNRVRAYFESRPGGMADWINNRYDSWYGRTGHNVAQKLSVGYVVYRFLIDARWLGLEAIDAPVLTFFREGPGAALEGLQKKRQTLPLFMDATEAEAMRNNWAWWMANSDVGTMLRQRERYVLGIARRYQDQEFPRAVAAYMRAMERIGTDMPEMQQALRMNGHTPMDWLRELDADWQLGMKRGRPLEPGEAEKLFGPWRNRKAADGGPVISQKEYDEFVKANRWTGHPRLEAELAYVADPRLQPLLERLAVINEQGWNDAARLVFGQTDRSNAQRLANHPLLYWPISYQIKATKWLGGLLFDRAFGYDTGSVGAVTLGQLHQMHKDRMANDPDYASTVVNNPTLLFAASMLFPIAPWEIGVSLSPMTRLALSMATNDDPAEAYRRNVFAMGPGYTYFNLLPRLLYEQSKPGSWAQGAGIVGDVVQRAQYLAPYSVPVAPKSRSQLESANAGAYTGMPPQPAPFTPPVAKQQ